MEIGKCRECIDYIARYLGLAISNIVSLLDITYVMLSGKTLSLYSQEIAKGAKAYISKYTGWEIKIAVNRSHNSTAVGAAI